MALHKTIKYYGYSYLILGFCLSLLIPTDILVKYSQLNQFCDFMSSIFVSITNLVNTSNFPQVTKVTFSFLWLFAPLLFFAFISTDELKGKDAYSNDKYSKYIYLLLMPLLFLAIAFGLDGTGNTAYTNAINLLLNKYRLGLAIVAPALVFSATFFLSLFIGYIFHKFSGRSQSDIS